MYKRPLRLSATAKERPEKKLSKTDRFHHFFHKGLGKVLRPIVSSKYFYHRYVPAIIADSSVLHLLSDLDFDKKVIELRQLLVHKKMTHDLLVKTFSLVREAAGRQLGMFHYESQLLGGLAIFHGNVAEMQTGEGKTLTATLPAAAAALMGVPVHVITVNEYLAERDSMLMAPVYRALGLSVGCISSDMTPIERKNMYACDIVYCTNKDLVFDYLKDQLVLKQYNDILQISSSILKGDGDPSCDLVLRGLHFAIVDEADSVLLDEARTPLVISGENGEDPQIERIYRQASDISRQLEKDKHFSVDDKSRQVFLTELGDEYVTQACENLGPYWRGRVRRKELIEKAVSAIHLFDNGRHYLVHENKIQIIDEQTGRVMPDRTWEQGLHQLIEIKEGCTLSRERTTLIKISYQRFFRLYHHLSGMTGTAKEVVDELWATYALFVVGIPTHSRSLRVRYPSQVFSTNYEKWQALAIRARDLSLSGRAVLVGTVSVSTSELIASTFSCFGLTFNVLNARQDFNEAEIIQGAGKSGCITIATNMAGRGTDIKIDEDVKNNGGLHVILTEFHEASRIDRQLEGRSARQGDPGSFEVFISMEDPLISSGYTNVMERWGIKIIRRNCEKRLNRIFGVYIHKKIQKRVEKKHAQVRSELLLADEAEKEILAFSGRYR